MSDKEFIEKLNKAAAIIAKASRTGSANYVCTSPYFGTYFAFRKFKIEQLLKII